MKNLITDIKSTLTSKENNSKQDYTIETRINTDITNVNPYTVTCNIVFNNKQFGKMVNNNIKHYDIQVNYEFKNRDIGTLFKPNKETYLQVRLLQNTVKVKTQLAIMDMATLGFLDLTLSGNTISIKTLKRKGKAFKSKEQAEMFKEDVNRLLTTYLKQSYNTYLELKETT